MATGTHSAEQSCGGAPAVCAVFLLLILPVLHSLQHFQAVSLRTSDVQALCGGDHNGEYISEDII